MDNYDVLLKLNHFHMASRTWTAAVEGLAGYTKRDESRAAKKMRDLARELTEIITGKTPTEQELDDAEFFEN